MPKNSADMDVLLPILEFYFHKNNWVENSEYIDYIKKYLLDNNIDDKVREPQHYTKRMQILSYFGFIEWLDSSNNQSPRKITESGKAFYSALKDADENKVLEIIVKSLKTVNFGRNNIGAPSSDSDIEAPVLCVRAILDLKFITKTEFAYLLWKLQDNGFTYSTVIKEIKDTRKNILKPIVLPEEAAKYTDWKPINFLERINFLVTEDSKTLISENVLGRYKNELRNLKIYNVDKDVNTLSLKRVFSPLIFNTKVSLNKSHNRILFGAPGTGKSHQLKEDSAAFDENYERVTFHPNYSYAQFVGTYKPTMIEASEQQADDETKEIKLVLQDKTKTAQEKYDLLFDKFKDGNLTRLPILLGIYSNGDFKTRKQDGTSTANDNIVETNHGRAIKPYLNLTVSKNNEIAYQYVPGPFTRVLVKALKNARNEKDNPKPFLLLIEEINRANVAAVFGDVFQLLDRDENGASEYEIETSEDLRKFLAQDDQLGGNPDDYAKIRIPNNMYIWATMNSADQGVMPMDVAFKRRWDFEYLGIDDKESEVSSIKIPTNKKDGGSYNLVLWNDFRKELNRKLKNLPNVNEDKLLGPFFLSASALENAEENPADFVKLFKSKVLMYLFEDVCKMNPSAIFPNTGIQGRLHYSDICEKFDEKGVEIFGDEFKSLLKENNNADDSAPTE